MYKIINHIKLLVPILAIVITGCSNHTPEIPISNSLEIALGNNYNSYVDLLNRSVSNDTVALLKFIKIDNINDAAGYDHGYILYKLLETIGDNNFSSALKKLSPQEKINFVNYFEVGVDANDSLMSQYKIKYPLSYDLIKSVK